MTDSLGITAADSLRHSADAAVSMLAGEGEGKTSEYSSTEEGL
ncbi:hypothetical protein [Enterobacter chuandaensis]|uniref:Uncharacterized protein n=1 Tax=Enterobacter chuandaensis TaxID=2497875 RepID=A0AA96M3A8_9ENTR|nr:hypothetical protein [Enterobacter chuandaensis]MDA4758102.1 hypothetical protein [Enterobacter chuandaensis]WNS38749.1 hypothetical protein RQP59_04065 [Enterobacter chuandaensis]